MSSLTFIFVLVTILAILFLVLNFLLAPRDPNSIKESPFECGFNSFLGQSRAHFDVQFFLVALVYLLLDLEILIIYPFAMSGRENGLYGLIIVLIIIGIITAGFIFELGRKALSINSRQNETRDLEDLQIDEDKESSAYIWTRNGKPNLQFGKIQFGKIQKRTYSVLPQPLDPKDPLAGGKKGGKPKKSKKNEFWSKVNSKDITNPSIIVKDFHFKYGILEQKFILQKITLDLIHAIMRDLYKEHKLTQEEFDALMRIVSIHMKNIRSAKLKPYENIGGVYVFTNVITGEKYVGSSISLAQRIRNGYLGAKLGNRCIESFIRDKGIESFTLDLYIIPQALIDAFLTRLGVESTDKTSKEYKNGVKMLSLTLEQILILLFNPSKNVLKVAGSTVGQRPERFKKTYLYDMRNKKLICITASRNEMGLVLGISIHEISFLIRTKSMYLGGRYRLTSELLDESEYSTDLLSTEEVSNLMLKSRVEAKAEKSQKIKVTHVETGDVNIFNSISDSIKYINTFGGRFSYVHPKTLYHNIKNKNAYHGVFLIDYYKDEDKDK